MWASKTTQSPTAWQRIKLAVAAGADLIGFSAATVYTAGTLGAYVKAIVVNLAASTGASLVGWIQAGTGAVARTVRDKLRERITYEDFGADPTGVADSTAAFNAAHLAAYKSALNVIDVGGEIYTVAVYAKPGADYRIDGKVLLPSQVVSNGRGARIIGPTASAAADAYNAAIDATFETATYDAGTDALVSNSGAASETVKRVVGAGIVNWSFKFCNCPVNAINLDEQSQIDGLRFSDCSAPLRLKGCFYTRIGYKVPLIVRNSAQHANQPAILLHGAAAHELYIDARIINAAVGLQVTATNSFSVKVFGSYEEGYASNSIGILNSAAYCQSWMVHAYMEGVRKGILVNGTGAFFACNFTPAYFSGTEYSLQSTIASGFRACTMDAVSAPDEGAGIANTIDLSQANQDCFVRMPGKARDSTVGLAFFPSNVLMGSGGHVMASSSWRDTTDASRNLALCDGRLANNSAVGQFPFEGRHTITMTNQVPFWTHSAPGAGTTVLLDSLITVDESTPLVGHVVISDNVGGPFTFDFIILGTTVYPLAAFGGARTLAAASNGGYYQLTFGGLNTNAGASYSVKGAVRMM